MPIDLKEMLKAGVHFGHKTARWSPKMRPYIWGARNKVHLIDISKTAFLLEKTGEYLRKTAAQGGSFLWVGTKKAAQDIVKSAASSLSMPYVVHRWIGGTLSNFDQVKKAVTRLLHLRDVSAKPLTHYTKKELVVLNKEIERLEKNVGGIISLRYPPAGLIIVDAKKEESAIREAARLGIPIISLVDTNTDPEDVNFIIPCNDDSPKSIAFIVAYLQEQVALGVAEHKENKSKQSAADLLAKQQGHELAAGDNVEITLPEDEEESEEKPGGAKKPPVVRQVRARTNSTAAKPPVRRGFSKTGRSSSDK